jgi:hypothetical protein
LEGAVKTPSVRIEASPASRAASVLVIRVAQERKAAAKVTVILEGHGKKNLVLRVCNSSTSLAVVVDGGSAVVSAPKPGISASI